MEEQAVQCYADMGLGILDAGVLGVCFVQVEALCWARERHCLAFRISRVETGF